MKKIIGIACVLLCTISAYSQQFTVKGKLSGINEPVDVELEYRGEKMKTTSNDGSFEFKGNSIPAAASLRVMPYIPNLNPTDTAYWVVFAKKQHLASFRDIFLEDNVTVVGKSLTDAKISGSKKQDLYESFRSKLEPLEKELAEIRRASQPQRADAVEDTEDSEDNATEETPRDVTPAEKQLLEKVNDMKIAFVERYPDSYFSLDLAKLESREDPATFEKMVNTLGKSLHGTTLYKSLASMLAGSKMGNIGNKAMDFSLSTAEGKELALGDYKGKYILLDFWASWCVPCRAENPNLVAAFDKFKSRNFDILSVSIDDNKDAWIKAVKDDKLPWSQVVDRKGNTSVAIAYNVTGVPQNYLIDPSGKIIAKNLRGAELAKTLEKMLK